MWRDSVSRNWQICATCVPVVMCTRYCSLVGWNGYFDANVVERLVDLLEVPRVLELDVVRPHLGLGRDRAHVAHDLAGERLEPLLEQQLEPVDHQVLVTADVHGRPPLLPAVPTLAHRVEGDAQKPDHDGLHGELS